MDLPIRPRRLRVSESMREWVAETSLSVRDLMFPIFVCEGRSVRRGHPHLGSCLTVSLDELSSLLAELEALQVRAVMVFGVVDSSVKDEAGSLALSESGPVVSAVRFIREKYPHFVVGTDVALDPYTSHGHDGLFEAKKKEILNDASVEVLSKMALLHAEAGADIVCPSDMMDGRVGAIRAALDDRKFQNTSIMAYTAKYASSLYGPFRETLSAEVVGDKKTYQMDPRNRREALRELELDLAEGADFVMVKPASWYLDVISDMKAHSSVPVVAYQVSGECAMIEVAAKAGALHRDRAILESAYSIKRAGADLIITYFALDLARLLISR